MVDGKRAARYGALTASIQLIRLLPLRCNKAPVHLSLARWGADLGLLHSGRQSLSCLLNDKLPRRLRTGTALMHRLRLAGRTLLVAHFSGMP